MNSNGFTKRNLFIGDVKITEDLVCGDMICEEMTLTGNINLDDQDIVGVNNIETKTINGSTPMLNPATGDLDMFGYAINNNPQLDNLQDKTQYISVVAESTETQFAGSILVNGDISNPNLVRFTNDSVINGSETDLTISVAGIGKISTDNIIETTSDLKCDNLTAVTSISAPQITTLQNKTQYLSASGNVSTFTGEVKASTLTATTTISAPQITTLQNQTQYLSASGNVSTFTGEVKASTLTATTTISAPQITTLQNKTQYLTASGNTSTFTGDVKVTNILNGTNLSVGDATPNNTGYFFPPRPLGVNYCLTTGTAASNVLVWTFANLQSIFNLTAVPSVSSTFTGSLFLNGGGYQLPAASPTVANQYLVFSGTGTGSFTSQPNPSYGRISRTNSVTGAIVLTAGTTYRASALGAGIFVTDHEKTADITTNLTTGVITYTGPPKILTLSGSIRVSVTAGGINNTFNFYLINSDTNAIILRDTVFLQASNTRFQLNLSYTQLVATNFAVSFAVLPDGNATATFSSLQLAMNP